MKGTSPSRASGTAQNICHSGLTMRISLNINSQSKEEVMNKLSTLPVVDNAADIVTVSGIDLAKNLFVIHGTNAAGKTVPVRPRMRRHQLLDMLAQLPLCIIGMEACSGAHHWAQLVAFESLLLRPYSLVRTLSQNCIPFFVRSCFKKLAGSESTSPRRRP